MSTPENNILTLAEILDQYVAGTLDMSVAARKYYLTEKHKFLNKPEWIHNDELKNQALLRHLSKSGGKDLLRQTREKL
jgi:hypothetical protein